MGRPYLAAYGEVDLGTAIQTNKEIVAKIESNKYDDKDLIALAKTTFEIVVAIIENDEE